jgi:hypothetical protein
MRENDYQNALDTDAPSMDIKLLKGEVVQAGWKPNSLVWQR